MDRFCYIQVELLCSAYLPAAHSHGQQSCLLHSRFVLSPISHAIHEYSSFMCLFDNILAMDVFEWDNKKMIDVIW